MLRLPRPLWIEHWFRIHECGRALGINSSSNITFFLFIKKHSYNTFCVQFHRISSSKEEKRHPKEQIGAKKIFPRFSFSNDIFLFHISWGENTEKKRLVLYFFFYGSGDIVEWVHHFIPRIFRIYSSVCKVETHLTWQIYEK